MSAPRPERTWAIDEVQVDDPFTNFAGRSFDGELVAYIGTADTKPVAQLLVRESVEVS